MKNKEVTLSIDHIRGQLLEVIFQARSSENFKKKKLVQSLFAEIATAKESGLDFEQISQVISNAGVSISHHTLRSYFFQIKQDKEYQAVTGKPTTMLKNVYQQTSKKLESQHAYESVERAKEIAANVVKKKLFTTPPSIVNRVNSEMATSNEVRPVAVPAKEIEKKSGLGVRPATRPAVEYDKGVPDNHIDAIELRSQSADHFPTLEKDLELQEDNCVFEIESNKPFSDVLNTRQIALLKRLKKLIAPSSSRTESDFVKMNKNL